MTLMSRFAIFIFCLAYSLHSYGQASLSSSQEPCAAAQSDDSPRIDISIANVSFWGSGVQLPISDQNDIAARVESTAHGSSVEDVTDEALELVREAWQDHGYFQAHVTGDARTISSNAISQRISLSIHVEEGFQYRLQEITFKHNNLFYSSTLRKLFPIENGEVVERQKIAKGLENLKRAYDNQGFLNYTPIPTPSFDETNRLMSWEIDIDEGKQFYVRDLKVIGRDEAAIQTVLGKLLLKRGDLYDENLLNLSLEQQGLKLPECACRGMLHMDEKNGTVDIVLDFRPCNEESSITPSPSPSPP